MITIGYSTREHNPKLQEYFKKSCGNHIKGVEVIEKINSEGRSLTEVYNEILEESKNDIVVLCHDDIYFETKSWGTKLIEHFENSDYGILGVAGTTIIPESGKWWEDQSKMVGIVNHEHQGKKWESKYCKNWNNEILKTVMVDGLFISLHKKRIKHNFNTDVEGFHFYDVEFSTQNYLEQVNIGVLFNIRITHKSIGMTNDQWEVNRVLYSVRNKKNLPIQYIPEIPTISNKQDFKFKVILQSTDTEKTKSIVDKIKTFEHDCEIVILSNSLNYEELKVLDNVNVVDCFYDDFIKNLDIIKHDETILDNCELVFFVNDSVEIVNDVFSNSYVTYQKNKNSFGSWYPTSFYNNKSVLSSSLLITTTGENRYGFHLVNNGSYYNLLTNTQENPFGNFVNLFATTPKNLTLLGWYNSNFDNSLFFNEFSIRLFNQGKKTFTDTNSFVIDNNYENLDLIQRIGPDFQIMLQTIQQTPKIHPYIKVIKQQ